LSATKVRLLNRLPTLDLEGGTTLLAPKPPFRVGVASDLAEGANFKEQWPIC
jgi:hypothetical protein